MAMNDQNSATENPFNSLFVNILSQLQLASNNTVVTRCNRAEQNHLQKLADSKTLAGAGGISTISSNCTSKTNTTTSTTTAIATTKTTAPTTAASPHSLAPITTKTKSFISTSIAPTTKAAPCVLRQIEKPRTITDTKTMLSCATINNSNTNSTNNNNGNNTSNSAKLLYAAAAAAEASGVVLAAMGNRSAAGSTGAASGGAPSETQSEISSVDSDWSDIRAIALKLGVANPDDLHTERFKVDRQKLEQMLIAHSPIDSMNGAEYFFDSVMKTTETYISWPCRLKIGAKSKKDPHVRIVGKMEEVVKAKERVLANLDSKGNRVIMKMDVSYTDHSYIIGRGGNNIKRIMEETQTHIHFPDSNRSNPTEKSNQVSLCGSMEGVERARSLVRLSTPLLYSFELPVMAHGRPQPDRETPYVKMIETKYMVQVIFSSRPKLHSSLVLVKGSEKDAKQVQEATQLLINFSCDSVAHQTTVQMQLEISPQHHEVVKGKNNCNLVSIMERTRTTIIFPDLTDMNVKELKKSQVTITGTIDGVYKARQQLLGNLPIALIFDFPENQSDASYVMSLSTRFGVYITLRQKQRQGTLAIVVKGIEKYIDKMYEARNEILHLNEPLVKASIPETYFAPKDRELNLGQLTALTNLLARSPDSPKTPSLITTTHVQITQFMQQQQHQRNAALLNNNNNNNLLMSNNKSQAFLGYPPGTPPTILPPTQKYLQMHNNNMNRQQQAGLNNNYLHMAPPPALPPPGAAQHQAQPGHPMQQQQQQQQKQMSPRNSCHNTSGYQSFSSSTTSLEQAYPPFGVQGAAVHGSNGANGGNSAGGGGTGNGVTSSRSHYSPDSTYSSEAGCSGRLGRRSSDGVLLGLGASGPIGPLVAGSAESYRNLNYDMKRTFDFDMKRAMGFKAMERPPVSGELRTPNANWMGLALSRTSPTPLEGLDDISWHRSASISGAPISPYGLGATTGLVESTPTNRRLQLTQHKDIHSLLTSLGLEHYIKIFVLNEIDLDMFSTLTEENLMELGITAFGARKKMICAVQALQANAASCATMPTSSSTNNKNSSPRFSGSAAPGAERRPSNQW